MGARRPLQPLSPGRRKMLRVVVVGWILVAISAWIAVAEGDLGMLVLAIGGPIFAAGWTYEIRRRSDPARTAGWGRPQGYTDRD